MAYTTINKPTDHFNTKLYTGNGSTNAVTGVGFQPDWVWLKKRNSSAHHQLFDAVRGVTKRIYSSTNGVESTDAQTLTAFGTDGFTLGTNSYINGNSDTFASWNWKAGGTAPAITYTVKVVSDSGNKYRFNDFGTSAVTLDLQEGGTYTFDQADSSNSGHPLRFYTAADKTGGEYTTGVTTNGTPGSSGAYTRITVAASAPTLYYYCTQHSGMGGQANTNSTFGSSNFSGSIQATASANTTAGFSISKYTGNATSGATIGHGLGVTPKMIIIKGLETTYNWIVGHNSLSTNWTNYLTLSTTDASSAATNIFNDTAPTSSVFSIGNALGVNTNNSDYIAYCFAEKTGYSQFGSYTGNGDSDGTFVYTGFKPAWIINKRIDSSTGGSWILQDNKRGNNVRNPVDLSLSPTNNQTESDWGDTFDCDYLSNGFKWRMNGSGGYNNTSGATYIYMAFAEAPLVGSNNIPCTAR